MLELEHGPNSFTLSTKPSSSSSLRLHAFGRRLTLLPSSSFPTSTSVTIVFRLRPRRLWLNAHTLAGMKTGNSSIFTFDDHVSCNLHHLSTPELAYRRIKNFKLSGTDARADDDELSWSVAFFACAAARLVEWKRGEVVNIVVEIDGEEANVEVEVEEENEAAVVDSDEEEKEKVCGICEERMKEEMEVVEMSCGHRFHCGCIAGWLQMAKGGDCPECGE